jgi:copper chaperone CopZ
MTKHEFTVAMTCDGCKKAVNAVLTKTPGKRSFTQNPLSSPFNWFIINFLILGVEKVEIDVPSQTVVVEGTATQEQLLAAIQKTGTTNNLLWK